MYYSQSFWHLSESRFCLALYTEEANLQTFVMIFCKTICWTTYAQKVLFWSLVFKKSNIFTFYHSKTDCKLCRISSVDNFEADFQQNMLVWFFWVFTILVLNIGYSNSAKKSQIFSLTTIPKNHFTIEVAKVRPIIGSKSFSINIWEQNTETEKTNGLW